MPDRADRHANESSTNYSTLLTFYEHHFNFLLLFFLYLLYCVVCALHIFEDLYACMPFFHRPYCLVCNMNDVIEPALTLECDISQLLSKVIGIVKANKPTIQYGSFYF